MLRFWDAAATNPFAFRCGTHINQSEGGMKIQCIWNEGMHFTAESGGYQVAMDAKKPIGKEAALTPKELVLAGLCG